MQNSRNNILFSALLVLLIVILFIFNGCSGEDESDEGGSCVPKAEECDGIDNDCDEIIDEDLSKPCKVGNADGISQCENGSWGSCSINLEEVCNSIDDNEDGRIDEDLTRECVTICGKGVETCSYGEWINCTAQTPNDESCNNLDDDCDGLVDEDSSNEKSLTKSCQNQNCGTGTQTCTNGSWSECTGSEQGAEICDGIDNDCDGKTDENDNAQPLSRDCTTGCGDGTQTCGEGKWSKCSSPEPQPEICDNIDNNCNGQVDENVIQECRLDECGTGYQHCSAGQWGICEGESVSTDEICNNIDDDCDGKTDEDSNNQNLTQNCNTPCGEGTQTCSNGNWGSCQTGLSPDCQYPGEQESTSCSSEPGLLGICAGTKVRTCKEDNVKGCTWGEWGDCSSSGVEPADYESCNNLDDDCDGDIDELEDLDIDLCDDDNSSCIDWEYNTNTEEFNDYCNDCIDLGEDPENAKIFSSIFKTYDEEDWFCFRGIDGTFSWNEDVTINIFEVAQSAGIEINLFQAFDVENAEPPEISIEDGCSSRELIGSVSHFENGNASVSWSERFGSADDGMYFIQVKWISGSDSCYELIINGLN